jgi:hypothetical protein
MQESQIYVPIDLSKLSELIPPGDDILYSTICKLIFIYRGGNKQKKWNSHVLVTKSGIATHVKFSTELRSGEDRPGKQKYSKNENIAHFFKWTDLKGQGLKQTPFTSKKVLVLLTKFQFLHLMAVFDGNFETKKDFNRRKGAFAPFCKSLWQQANGKL